MYSRGVTTGIGLYVGVGIIFSFLFFVFRIIPGIKDQMINWVEW